MIISGQLTKDNFASLRVFIHNPITAVAVEVTAIIDSGAWPCLIQKKISNLLNLTQESFDEYLHPQEGKKSEPKYLVDLTIGGATLRRLPVTRMDNDAYPCDLIIGVSCLSTTKFVYDGINRAFELHL